MANYSESFIKSNLTFLHGEARLDLDPKSELDFLHSEDLKTSSVAIEMLPEISGAWDLLKYCFFKSFSGHWKHQLTNDGHLFINITSAAKRAGVSPEVLKQSANPILEIHKATFLTKQFLESRKPQQLTVVLHEDLQMKFENWEKDTKERFSYPLNIQLTLKTIENTTFVQSIRSLTALSLNVKPHDKNLEGSSCSLKAKLNKSGNTFTITVINSSDNDKFNKCNHSLGR